MRIRPGEDRREDVIDTTKHPFLTNSESMAITLINSRLLLKESQNLYPRYSKKEPDSMVFTPTIMLWYALMGL